MEITVLHFFNPTKRVFDTCEVIFSRKGEKTVCEIAINMAHQVLAFLHIFSHTRIIIGQVLLVQYTETTTKTISIFTDAKNRVVILFENIRYDLLQRDSRIRYPYSKEILHLLYEVRQ